MSEENRRAAQQAITKPEMRRVAWSPTAYRQSIPRPRTKTAAPPAIEERLVADLSRDERFEDTDNDD